VTSASAREGRTWWETRCEPGRTSGHAAGSKRVKALKGNGSLREELSDFTDGRLGENGKTGEPTNGKPGAPEPERRYHLFDTL